MCFVRSAVIVLISLHNVANSLDNFENNELLSVIVLFRHGDRTPAGSYKTDPYNESYWPLGFGQLTNTGKLQHYNLGKWFRERYADFLSTRYSPDYIRIRSSNSDTCLMSASAYLAGLYPPVGDQIWHASLPWQPVPIHTMPKEKDAVIAQSKRCPNFGKLRKELLETEYFKNMLHKYQVLFQYLSESTGENINSIDAVRRIFNILYIQNLYNFTLPEWTRGVYHAMETIANSSFVVDTNTTDLARLSIGPLIELIASTFEQRLSGSGNVPNLLILSGPDNTISSLLNSLNIFDGLWPEYASSVILELRQNQNNPFVNIFYKNSTYTKSLTLNECDFDCRFDSFQKIIEPVRLDSEHWEKDCISEIN